MRYISGVIYDGNEFINGHLGIGCNGTYEIGEGEPPERPFMEGVIIPGLIDCHTHVGDAGMTVPAGVGLEELVSPPDGLKHRYLEHTADDEIVRSMKEFTDRMYCNGISGFADFREGGVRGCELLLKASPTPEATILGRPVSLEYDWNEVESILDIADGIGISSISDIDHGYVTAVADHVHRRGKIFALHASERIREDIDSVLSLEPDLLVHMTMSSDSDMRRCSDADVPIVLCPRSNLYFGMTPPVRRMMSAGVTLALGTDNAMLCSPDVRAEMNILLNILDNRYKEEDILPILLSNGRKILNQSKEIDLDVGMYPDIRVFPLSKGGALTSILESSGCVFGLGGK